MTKRVPRVTKRMRSLKAKRFAKVKHTWGVAAQWNKSMSKIERREPKERNYLWATDMSKSHVDTFLDMKATKPSNPPNARALRKFEAGDVFEWIVKLILMRAGILKHAQIRCEYQYKGLLKMTGRIDYIAGGKPDLKKVKADLETMDLPDVFKRGALAIVSQIKRQYPKGLPEMPFEVKSISSFIADSMERKNRSIKHHREQIFHYLKSSRYDTGMLIYLCRDDLRMFEYPVYLADKTIEKDYKKYIKTMTDYYKRDEQPPLEDMIVFDEDAGKFSKNFKVEYSKYLKKLYGLKEPRNFSEIATPKVMRWNRVLSRVKNGDKMTDKNNEALAEMKSDGFNVKKIIREFSNGESNEE
ncbi:MAG: hypothetical protein NUV49_03600 [Patescibacteria group bacterium]|nr:hypothetical protein [Patescibacteria group bacterium]